LRPKPIPVISSDAEMMRERHLTEKDPEELRTLIVGLLGGIPGAFIVLDKQWHLVYLNHDAQEIFMSKDESLLGRPLEEVYPKWFSHLLSPHAIGKILEGKENNIIGYVNHVRKWFKVSANSTDFGIFVRLENITQEMASNRLMRLNQFSVNGAMDMVFWFKPSGHIIYANIASCNSLGFEKNELVSMMVADIDPTFTNDKWAKFVEDLKTKCSMAYESSLRASNQSIIPVEVTCSYQVHHGEEYLIAFARDITKRKRAEEAQRENEARLSADLAAVTLLQKVSARFVEEGDLDALLEDVMDAAIDIAGADMGTLQLIEPMSDRLEIVAHHGFEQLYLDFFSSVSHGTAAVCGKALQQRDRVIVEDVRQSPIFIGTPAMDIQMAAGVRAVQSTPLVNRRGSVIGILSTHWRTPHQPDERVLRYIDLLARQATDIIERKQAEEALRESEERLLLAQQVARIGTFEWNIQTGVNTWTPELEAMYGLPVGGFPGTQPAWERLVYYEDRAEAVRRVSEAIEKGDFEGEWRVVWPDGTIHWLYGRAFVFKDEVGQPLKLLGVNIDITERKLAEEQLRATKAQVELYLDLMGHDINNMNQSAMGYLELALETLEAEGRIRLDDKLFIEKPIQAIQSSSKLIENVIKLQRLMTEGIKTKPVDLHNLFDELKTLDFHMGDKDVTVNIEKIPHYVVEGSELLRDVFFNLISNAVKHSSPDQPVTVDVRVERINENGRAFYRCAVEDDGPGIPDELKAKLFHRFERGKTKAHGKGLGLYIVRTLVEGYHGKVWVEDRVRGDYNQGTRFVAMLPAAEK